MKVNGYGISCKSALGVALLLAMPLSAAAKTHWYQPQYLTSVEEASNRLEFFSPHFAPVSQAMGYDTLTTGYSLQRVDVNKLGINLSFTKSGVNTHSQYFWTWGGGYNAPVSTPYKDDIVTQIVYADVSYFEISHNDKASGFPATWCVDSISRGPNRNSTICVSSEQDAHGLADALATLVVAGGGNVGTSSGMGIAKPSEKDLRKHPEQAGLEVREVDLEGPPAQAGIQEKDVIRTINGHPSTDRDFLFTSIKEAAKTPGGGVVHLEILRKNKPMSFDLHYPFVKVDAAQLQQQVANQVRQHAETPAAASAPAAPPQGVRFGFQVRAVKEADVALFGLAKARGIVVVDVTKGGLADVMGFLPGDVILEVNNSEIGDLELFTQFVHSGAVKTFRVWRKGQALELTVPLTL
jgi:hypothetical protein